MTVQFEKWQSEEAALEQYPLLVCVKDGVIAGEASKALDAMMEAGISHLLTHEKDAETQGKIFLLRVAGLGKKGLARVLVLSLGGKKDTLDEKNCLAVGGKMAGFLSSHKIPALGIPPGILTDEQRLHFCRGFFLKNYRFDRYLSKKEEKSAELILFDAKASDVAGAFSSLDASLAGIYFTRDLVSEPPNILHPEDFAERLEELQADGLECVVLDDEALEKMGAGAFLGVGRGSERGCRLVTMHWKGAKDSTKTPLALVGKGVTFDTGGISLKPPAGMGDMKWDMGGAGTVAGAMKMLALRKAPVNVVGVVGLVENMPDGRAQRPGDIVTSLSGQTIEVLNTDAEGRLVLADLLTYTQRHFKPDYIIDLATLTGAIIASLGHHYAGLFSNDEGLGEKLRAAGERMGERLWPFPMGPEYDNELKSPFADMKNIGGRLAGSITAAQFLQRFIDKDVKWAHLDVAGVVWLDKPTALAKKGASGFGVRLLDNLVKNDFEAG